MLSRPKIFSVFRQKIKRALIFYLFANLAKTSYLSGPALFRGRLRAFGKCTNGVAFSKGRPNLASVRFTL